MSVVSIEWVAFGEGGRALMSSDQLLDSSFKLPDACLLVKRRENLT